MPLHDYRCADCGAVFEMLVTSSTVPACRGCGGSALECLVSLTAAPATHKAVIAAGRRAAAKEGHFSHYSQAERAKVPKASS